MNRKANSILFVIAATVVNIIVMMILYVVLLITYAQLIAPLVPAAVSQGMLLVLFIVSVVVTYILYHQFMIYLGNRFDLNKYFGPVFGKTRLPQRRRDSLD